eukprot:7387852-Prymnesium_polylepis.1
MHTNGLAAQSTLVLTLHQLELGGLADHLRRVRAGGERRVHLQREQHVLGRRAVEVEALGELGGELLAKRLEHRGQRRRVDLLPDLRVDAARDDLDAVSERLVAHVRDDQVVEAQVDALPKALRRVLAHRRHLAWPVEKALQDLRRLEVARRQAAPAVRERVLLVSSTAALLKVVTAVAVRVAAVRGVVGRRWACGACRSLGAGAVRVAGQRDPDLHADPPVAVAHLPEAQPAREVLGLGAQRLVLLQTR